MVQTETRNAQLGDLVQMLNEQNAQKLDAAVPAQAIQVKDGNLHIDGMGPDGPAGAPGIFRPTQIMDGHLADRLGVPVKYVRWMRESRVDLYDVNLNALIHGVVGGREAAVMAQAATILSQGTDSKLDIPVYAPDDRTFFVRTFADASGGIGMGRAVLSDRYQTYDNLDMLLALLAGVQEAGVNVDITSCDLSERRMIVKINAPEIFVNAPELMKGYNSPFGRQGSGTYGRYGVTARTEGLKVGDIVSAGLVATNSETGGGAWTITPRFEFLTCTNGMTMTKDAMRSIHLGGKLEEGVVQWSADTEERNVTLITGKTRDAVTTFLNADYVTKVIEKVTEKSTKPIDNPAELVELIGKKMLYSEDEQQGILNMFIKGGVMNCGGILHAVTAQAQEVADSDRSLDLEASALDALEAAYALA